MAGIFVERRELTEDMALTWDLAHHLYTRQRSGRIIIVADKPLVTLAALRKQWKKVIGKVRKEYSSTMNPERRERLEQALDQMTTLSFSARAAPNEQARVTILELRDLPPGVQCRTVYVTYEMDPESMQKARAAVLEQGLLVFYVRV